MDISGERPGPASARPAKRRCGACSLQVSQRETADSITPLTGEYIDLASKMKVEEHRRSNTFVVITAFNQTPFLERIDENQGTIAYPSKDKEFAIDNFGT